MILRKLYDAYLRRNSRSGKWSNVISNIEKRSLPVLWVRVRKLTVSGSGRKAFSRFRNIKTLMSLSGGPRFNCDVCNRQNKYVTLVGDRYVGNCCERLMAMI